MDIRYRTKRYFRCAAVYIPHAHTRISESYPFLLLSHMLTKSIKSIVMIRCGAKKLYSLHRHSNECNRHPNASNKFIQVFCICIISPIPNYNDKYCAGCIVYACVPICRQNHLPMTLCNYSRDV